MNQNDEQSSDRVERLLRRWGAEEAARENSPGAVSHTAQFRAGSARARARPWSAPAVRRWLPVAASLALVLLAAALFVTARRPEAPERAAPAAALAQLTGELAQARDELTQSRAALAEAQRQLQQAEGPKADLARLEQSLAEERASAAAAGHRADLAAEAAGQKQIALEAALAELRQSQAALVGLKGDFDKSRLALEQVRRDFADETARLRGLSEQAQSARRDAEEKLAGLLAQQDALWPLLQRTYLAAAQDADASRLLVGTAAGLEDLGLRQLAARRYRLLERCTELRPQARGVAARQMLDRLEVLLTRLELLDARSRADVRSFTALVRSADLAALVEQTLPCRDETPAVQAWLLECRLLLMGVERAG